VVALSVLELVFFCAFRVLFHNKQDIWEEIEAKINAENDIPVLKGSNKVGISRLIGPGL
jgi:hypothetical protein